MKSLSLKQKEESFLQGGKPFSVNVDMALISQPNVQHCTSSPGNEVCKTPSPCPTPISHSCQRVKIPLPSCAGLL